MFDIRIDQTIRIGYVGDEPQNWCPLIADALEVHADGGTVADGKYTLTLAGAIVASGDIAITRGKE